jgi:tetratricopeptide (TPR) repeat protein
MKRIGPALMVTAIAIVGASYLFDAPRAQAPTGADAPRIERGSDPALEPGGGIDLSEVERLIGAYEPRVAARPDAVEFTFLARLYLLRAREMGDLAGYLQAEAALGEALERAPNDPESRTLLASTQLSLHDFAGALATSLEVAGRDPAQLGARAVAADALLELGRYEEGRTALEDLASDAPGTAAVTARRARLAFLDGDPAEAWKLASRARHEAIATGIFGSGLAWYATFQGQLAFDAGRYAEAAALAREALETAPRSPHASVVLGRALAALGRTAAAIDRYEAAVRTSPQPDALAALVDLYALTGRDARASARAATLRAIARIQASRDAYDRNVAAYDVDHGHARRALRVAEEAIRTRRDIYGWDLLAWARYRAGDLAGARRASDRALALGTLDARLWFHAGMISSALDEPARARRELALAIELGPAFDPVAAPVARETLAELGGRS